MAWEWLIVIIILLFSVLWFFISSVYYKKSIRDAQRENHVVEEIDSNPNSPKCVFCAGTPLSKEHLWPDWLKSIVPRTGVHKHGQEFTEIDGRVSPGKVAASEFKKFQGHMGNRKVKVVCEKCNNGWMSKLENEAKPILTALILDKSIELSKEEQTILANWAILRNIIGQYTSNPENRPIRLAERQRFMTDLTPSSEWKIWIAKNKAKDWQFRYFSNSVYMGKYSDPALNRSDIPPKNTLLSVFAVENLLIYTAWTSKSRARHMFNFYNYDSLGLKMRSVYPFSNESIQWERLPALNNNEANQLRDVFTGNNFFYTFRPE